MWWISVGGAKFDCLPSCELLYLAIQLGVGFHSRNNATKSEFLLEKQHPTKEKTMKKVTVNQHDPDLLDEYDFSQGVRGKYAQRYREGTNIVRLDDDVAQIFPDAKSVNEALRGLGKIINQHRQKA